jgi:hypothetical protein
MTDKMTSGATAPTDDLRSSIKAALAESGNDREAPVTSDSQPPSSGQGSTNHPAGDDQRLFTKIAEGISDLETDFAAAIPAGPDVQPSQASEIPKALPPPGWSVAAKAAFDALPEAVKEAVAKREGEVSAGFARYEGLSPYVNMARKAGSTLPEALDRYIAAENHLAQDFGSGILSLCQIYQVDPAQLGQFLLGGQGGGQQQASSDAFAPVLNQLNSVNQRLTQWERQMEERENESIQTELSRFAADPKHKFFENVRQTMGQIIAANPQASLSEAYESACWMNPEIRALLISEKAHAEAEESRRKADQARRASGSLPNGSPIPGASSANAPAPTLRAELERAFQQARI